MTHFTKYLFQSKYLQLYSLMEKEINFHKNTCEKDVFIRHYHHFLSSYNNEYQPGTSWL